MKQGGRRRANMGVLSVSHPDVRSSSCTRSTSRGAFSNFNLSVSVTDEFMRAASAFAEWPLVNPRDGYVTARVDARELWQSLAAAAWRGGDPGMLFADAIERANPTPHLGGSPARTRAASSRCCHGRRARWARSTSRSSRAPRASTGTRSRPARAARRRSLEAVLDANRWAAACDRSRRARHAQDRARRDGAPRCVSQKLDPYGRARRLAMTAGRIMVYVSLRGRCRVAAPVEERWSFPAWNGARCASGRALDAPRDVYHRGADRHVEHPRRVFERHRAAVRGDLRAARARRLRSCPRCTRVRGRAGAPRDRGGAGARARARERPPCRRERAARRPARTLHDRPRRGPRVARAHAEPRCSGTPTTRCRRPCTCPRAQQVEDVRQVFERVADEVQQDHRVPRRVPPGLGAARRARAGVRDRQGRGRRRRVRGRLPGVLRMNAAGGNMSRRPGAARPPGVRHADTGGHEDDRMTGSAAWDRCCGSRQAASPRAESAPEGVPGMRFGAPRPGPTPQPGSQARWHTRCEFDLGS